MADSNTTTYSFTLPEVGASADSWGTKLNANWDKVDDLLDGSIAVNGITVTGGSIDGTPVGATTPSTGAFTTVTTTGVDVTGTVTADGLTVDGTATIQEATGTTLTVKNTGDDVSTIVLGNTGSHDTLLTQENGVFTIEDGGVGPRFSIADNGDVSFYEDTGTTAKMVWDASAESLSIGDAVANDSKLVIRGGDYDPTTNGGMNSKGISIRGGTAGLGNRTGAVTFSTNAGGANAGSAAISGVLEHASSDDVMGLAFFTHASTTSTSPAQERMRIDSSGNVGIGESDPSGYWGQANHLVINDGNTGITIKSSSVGNGRLVFTDTKSTTSGLSDGGMITYGHATDVMTFQTAGTERARIDSSGRLLVNTTDTDLGYTDGDDSGVVINGASGSIQIARSSHYAKLYINTKNNEGALVDFHKDGTKVGSITHNGSSAVSYNTTSDERLKENIQDTTHTVDINDLQVREFDWKVDGSHQRYGFIAQELETVYPEAVHSPEDADEMKSVDYSKLVPLLVKEIQQLKAEIKELKA